VIADLGRNLAAGPQDRVLVGNGGALLPGLAEHHLHAFALAAKASSLDLAGSSAVDDLPDPEGIGWLRVVGAGRELGVAELDRRWPDRPVRVQHRSGALWMLNSVAVELLSVGLTAEEKASGQLWRADDRLRELLSAAGQSSLPDLICVGSELVRHGITHITEASPDLDEPALDLLDASLPQHTLSLAAQGSGPRKIVLADHDLIDFATFTRQIRDIHDRDRAVAIHAVSAVTLAISIAALTESGTLPGDRIEHAAVCDDSAADRLAELGVTVVTQPSVFRRHGSSFTEESPSSERGLLWRYGGLVRAGVTVVASSDAPYGDADPWLTIAYASQRPEESVPARSVLASMLTEPENPGGPARHLHPGAPADLCLLPLPLEVALKRLSTDEGCSVSATFISGNLAYCDADLM
jgi:predicted amidohydrolase YtcJ